MLTRDPESMFLQDFSDYLCQILGRLCLVEPEVRVGRTCQRLRATYASETRADMLHFMHFGSICSR